MDFAETLVLGVIFIAVCLLVMQMCNPDRWIIDDITGKTREELRSNWEPLPGAEFTPDRPCLDANVIPCPRCDSKNVENTYSELRGSTWHYRIECKYCGYKYAHSFKRHIPWRR